MIYIYPDAFLLTTPFCIYYVSSFLNSPIQDAHNITVYMVPRNEETTPAISHYNFHRVHGAQIVVFSGTCRKKIVVIRRNPIETRSAIGKRSVLEKCAFC
jgi:hypothetical protein